MASPSKSYEVTTVEATGLAPAIFPGQLRECSGEEMELYVGMTRLQVIPPLARSTKVTFSLFRDKTLIGQAVIDLSEALAKSNQDAVLSLQRKGQEAGKLTVRVAEGSTTASSNAVDRVGGVTAYLAAPTSTMAADIASAAGDAMTSRVQSDLVGSLTSLISTLNILVKVEDEISKKHTWVNLVRNVLSVGLKLVNAHEDHEEKTANLVEMMQSTYLIVVDAENLADERVQYVFERVLRQMVICGFFVQAYARRGSSGQALAEFLSSTDALVAGYQATFAQLRDEFTGRIATKTAINIGNIAATLLDKLRPVSMDQSKCDIYLPKTRQDVIKLIIDLYSDGSEGRESAMWLCELAEASKSTISNMIARMIDRADGVNLLGAFFFFDNSPNSIRASAPKLKKIIKSFPGIASQPLAVQFSKLLSITALGDVPWSRGPVLVIIDALDESGSEAERLLVVSRHERDVSEQFKHATICHPPLMQVLYGHNDIVTSVCFSPDGFKTVSGSVDCTVRVWDAVTGQAAMPPLQGHEDNVLFVCFSPDGSQIASGLADKTVRLGCCHSTSNKVSRATKEK
ncbi:hypothetical protein FIBSPDRAFT_950476 [Athelia psychrophila]|uniref:Uncharacterized protein n=1 Tax=Athelia psychrophila TaxID=1759441 RepID=A0A166NK22_9AGAM|nr:hypothetical protein FIBSPDRAFT_950476 [Fibularhizoctonia sp. CBS 109695]